MADFDSESNHYYYHFRSLSRMDPSRLADLMRQLDDRSKKIKEVWKKTKAQQKPKPVRSNPKRDIHGVLCPTTAPRKKQKKTVTGTSNNTDGNGKF